MAESRSLSRSPHPCYKPRDAQRTTGSNEGTQGRGERVQRVGLGLVGVSHR